MIVSLAELLQGEKSTALYFYFLEEFRFGLSLSISIVLHSVYNVFLPSLSVQFSATTVSKTLT